MENITSIGSSSQVTGVLFVRAAYTQAVGRGGITNAASLLGWVVSYSHVLY